MAETPPIIRSSKAFSVEIPEGSKSAKARRSDIVTNDEIDIHHKSTQFHEAGTDSLNEPDFHTAGDKVENSIFAPFFERADTFYHEETTQSGKDRFAGDASTAHSDHRLSLDESQVADNLQALPDSGNAADNLQALPDESFRDRQADISKEQALNDRFAGESHSPLNDRYASVAQEGLTNNVQGIAQQALHGHSEQLSQDDASNNRVPGTGTGALKNNLQPGPDAFSVSDRFGHEAQDNVQDRFGSSDTESVRDHRAGIDQDTAGNHRQGLGVEGLQGSGGSMAGQREPAVNHQGIGQDALRDNHQSPDDEALHDNRQALYGEDPQANRQALDNEALADNRQSLAAESLRNNSAALPDDALHDNMQALSDQALSGRKNTQDKAHAPDHVIGLPDTGQVLRPGPSPLAAKSNAEQTARLLQDSPHTGATATDAKASSFHAGQAADAAMIKAEKARRLEEFHGRVEAIRKSVSGVNHLLDDLEEKD